MKFLKALRKVDDQTPDVPAAEGETLPQADGRFAHLVPNLVNDPNLKIGRDRQTSDLASSSHEPSESFDSGRKAELSGSKVRSFPSVYVDEAKVNPHFVAVTNPKSVFCEEYRNLRVALLHKSKKQKLKTTAVVSVAPSEGKSITALNLAWLIAQTDGMSALVIDADLRLPSLTKYLGIETEYGLSDVLDGDVRLEDAIIRLEPSGLHLLPGGRERSDVAEQLSGPTFAKLLEEVRDSFDFVIIDAPPLSVFAEAKVIMNQADGSLLVVRSNYTKFKDLERVLEGVPRQRILGVVLNRSDEMLIGGEYYDYPYYKDQKK